VKQAALISIGWLSMALGVIGMFLPVMPTVCFILLAAFCFSKSSPRLHRWIRSLPRLGPMVCEWEQYHVIRRRAKVMATAMIALAAAWLLFAVPVSALVKSVVIATMAAVLWFIWTRPATIEASLARGGRPSGAFSAG